METTEKKPLRKQPHHSDDWGGARKNSGRQRLYLGDVPVSRKQIRLPDSSWELLFKLYPDHSASSAFNSLLLKCNNMDLT